MKKVDKDEFVMAVSLILLNGNIAHPGRDVFRDAQYFVDEWIKAQEEAQAEHIQAQEADPCESPIS